LWSFHQRADVVAVAANAELTEQKNLNKWPQKSEEYYEGEENHGDLCDIRGNGK
jgi:general stress protein 26